MPLFNCVATNACRYALFRSLIHSLEKVLTERPPSLLQPSPPLDRLVEGVWRREDFLFFGAPNQKHELAIRSEATDRSVLHVIRLESDLGEMSVFAA